MGAGSAMGHPKRGGGGGQARDFAGPVNKWVEQP